MKIKLAFLGTGTCNSTPRNPSALAISNGNEVALIDCGGGCYHQLSRLSRDYFRHEAISTVLLTHFHADHASGLIDLIWGEMWDANAPRVKPLVIAGPPGTGRFINGRLLPFIGDYPIKFRIETVDLSDGEALTTSFFTARSHTVAHDDSSAGYLITAGGTRLAVTGDTGFCDSLVSLLSGSDLAVMEWSSADRESSPIHVSSGDIERLIQAGVLPRRVYVTHMYLSAGISREEGVRKRREFLGTHGDGFIFPDDLDVIDIG
ncbi:MAG: ribonuclease Z [Spirochaetes bacterium]|nr:ribonuclease Z [Spirochaetota bacterium]